jgi:O-antigen/teichoic acid export membrane protein
MNTDARIVRSFASLAGGEAVARGLAFVAALVVARRLGPSMYGIIGVASGILLYLNQIADAGIELSGVPAVARTRDGLQKLVSSTLTVRVVIALSLTILVVAAGLTVFPQPDGAVLALYALGLLFVATGTRWVFVGLQRTTWVAVARVAGELTALVIVLVAVRGAGDIGMVPIAALFGALVAAVGMLAALRGLGIRPIVRIDWATSQPLFARGPYLVGFTLLGLVLFNADLIYLRFISGEAEAGYYAAAYTFIAFAANLSVAWAHSVMPTLARFERADEGRNHVYQTAMLLAYTVSLPVAVGGMLIALPLIQVLFGQDYASAAAVLAWLLPAVPVAAIREIAVTGLIGTPGGERQLIRLNASCVAFNLIILIPIVPAYGMIGAAVVTVLTEILRLILAFRYASRAAFRQPSPFRFLKPGISVLLMVPVLVFAEGLPVAASIALGCVAYGAGLLLTGVIRLDKPSGLRVVV